MIEIRVVSRSDVPLDRLGLNAPLTARFGDAVGDIGRGADCTLVLPDPDRQISRKQVLITCRGGQHYICPIGANKVVELNGALLMPEVESALEDGAQIRIGPYLLVVDQIQEPLAQRGPPTQAAPPAARAAPMPPARPSAAPTAPQRAREAPSEDPLALLREPAGRASVFSDVLGTSPPAAPAAPSARPMVPPSPVQDKAPAPRRRSTDAEPPIDVAETLRHLDLDVGEPTGREVRKAVRRAKSNPTAARAKPDRPREAGADDLLAPLFSALGLPVPQERTQCVQQLRLVADLLRAAIGGTLELLAARTSAKRELGANATQLQTRENNPLKFSPDTDAALMHLLGPPERGFVAPVDAVKDAFSDLRAHQLAMLTGMRAALDEVLARFDPAALEPRLAPDALWDKLMPANRKAKLWEQYSQEYAAILREVEGDFDTLFGRAFLRAYQAQLAELARTRRPGTLEDT